MASRESNASQADGVTTSTSARSEGPKAVSVEIRGQQLSVRSNHNPEFVRKLAEHIDQKVEQLQQAAPAAPFSKLLMLASMTVAEELFEAREEIGRLRDEISQRTDAMLALLDEVEDQRQEATHSGSG